MSASPTTAPALRQGDARWFFGQLVIVRATGADTGGQYSLLEVVAPPGLASPRHIHHNEDEGFLVLEGDITVEVGDEVVHLSAGEFALGPREVPHRFEAGVQGARMLWVLTPSGFEDLVAAASEPARALTVPPPSVTPPEGVEEIVARFGGEILD